MIYRPLIFADYVTLIITDTFVKNAILEI